MHVVLVATAETDQLSPDPLTAPLTERGREQAARAAQQLDGTATDLLCVASDLASAHMADVLSPALRPTKQWDLPDLEPLNRDDLALDPNGSPLPSRWSPQQLRFGRERLWVRVTSTWARIEIYARAQGYKRVVIVADSAVLTMLTLIWRGESWHQMANLPGISAGEIRHIEVDGPASKERLGA